jgi:hypothetical protein
MHVYVLKPLMVELLALTGVPKTTEHESREGNRLLMPDTKIYNRTAQTDAPGAAGCSPKAPQQSKSNGGITEIDSKSGYFVASPNGTQVPIPKELYVAFSDFIKTRKCPGSIAIQFRSGEITCVEALARKTYRNSS